MGGKVWSEEEEKVFWTIIVPLSIKNVGIDAATRDPQNWHQLTTVMKEIMGDSARREYTNLCLCELSTLS